MDSRVAVLPFAVVALAGLAFPSLGEGTPIGAGPRLTTEEFFNEHLNTSRQAFRGIPAKMAAGDVAGAEKIFADYVRSALKPESFNSQWVNKTYTADELAALKARVANTLDYRFESAGAGWHQFKDRKIDWTFNPTFDGYTEWTWQFNRMAFWRDLAEYYVQTKDEKLVACWVDQVNSWLDQAQAPEHDNPYTPCTWRSIEAGIRMEWWSYQLHAFIRSPLLTDEFITRYFRSIWEHGHRLETSSQGRGNWVIMEKHGLLRLALVYPYFRESKGWYRMAFDRLMKELDDQVYPDGFQAELTTGYQGVLTWNYGSIIQLYKSLSLPVPSALAHRYGRLWEIYPRLMMPDGRTPNLNDGDRSDVAKRMREALTYEPARTDWQWFATGGKEGTPPDYTSYVFPWAGSIVFRTGWDRKAVWAYMDGSPFGMGHQHEDKLNVLMQAYGKDMITEGGCYFYDKSETRRYVLSTRAHNTIRVDGKDQYAMRTYRWETGDIAKKADVRSGLSPEIDWAEAAYVDGYGEQGCPVGDLDRTVHTRKLLFCKSVRGLPPFAVVVDRLVAPDERTRTYETMWHLETSRLKLEKQMFTADFGGGVGLVGVQSDASAAFTDMKGRKEPYFQGWMPVWRSGPHEQRPIPTPVAVGSFTGSRRMVTVLWPYEKGRPDLVAAEASADVKATGFKLVFGDGNCVEFDESALTK